jgi:acetolactate synthase-1/3 small subunit
VEVAETLKAEIADVGVKWMTILCVGDQTKIKTLLELVKPYGIKEIVRTGRIALSRDSKGD